MKILFLSSWYPYPPDNGSKLRVYNLLQGLARQHEVTLLSFAGRLPAETPPALRTLCCQVIAVPRPPYQPNSPRALAGLFSLAPRSVLDTYQPLMAEQIRRLLQDEAFHLVIASQWRTAAYWPAFAHLPAIYEEVELGVFTSKVAQAAQPLQRLRHHLTVLKLQQYLRRLLPRFRACTIVSEAEKSLLQELVPGYQAVHLVPNCVNLADYAAVQRRPQPESLIFTGSLSYFANHDSMSWFLEEVYPRIQAQAPTVRLVITGDPGHAPLPPAGNVTLTGFVDDVRPLIASATASLAPIRLGGGTRLKILEAMALGTPVVTTSKGAEGLEVAHGEHLLIADTPEEFASAVLRLLQDPELCRQLANNACRLISRKYDWTVVMPEFLCLVESMAYVN
ncbi:MAG: glycosyltransferase [Chloroflexi bacterium]|nr:glycosyltransferase [Chloroflexota bacterium]MCI0645747.1 glycosyltransferase [Chloroflexota bacterium]MCI0727674.1 glycosyltransferase [Chloroflexota bacterium]